LAVAIAGEVVASVSGEPWDRYVKGHVLDPLGMTATLTDAPGGPVPNLATAYGRRLPDLSRPPWLNNAPARGMAPAAGMASSVKDLAKYVAMQFRTGPAGGGQVVSGATLFEMHRVHWLNPDWQSGQGIGFSVRHVGDRTLVGHAGIPPGMRTQLTLDPKAHNGGTRPTDTHHGHPPPNRR